MENLPIMSYAIAHGLAVRQLGPICIVGGVALLGVAESVLALAQVPGASSAVGGFLSIVSVIVAVLFVLRGKDVKILKDEISLLNDRHRDLKGLLDQHERHVDRSLAEQTAHLDERLREHQHATERLIDEFKDTAMCRFPGQKGHRGGPDERSGTQPRKTP